VFSERHARREARRYQRRGLDSTARRIRNLLTPEDVDGVTLLEVGGGIGTLQVELLKAGLGHVVGVEMTPTYQTAADGLLRAAGLEGRVERRLMDFAEAGTDVAPADIVVLNRVICCYPDMPKLVGTAAEHASHLLVLSFPNRRWWTRSVFTMSNIALWLLRRQFRLFLHRPGRILAAAEQAGLATVANQTGVVWQVVALRRHAA
jgi:2-polyprenyl-3-methyl-5-hydroxy-6-metoxy-1,4-benzoquinol methylase